MRSLARGHRMFVQVSNAYRLAAVPPAAPDPVQLPASLLPNSGSESRAESRFQVKEEALRETSQRVIRGSGTPEVALARLQESIEAKEAQKAADSTYHQGAAAAAAGGDRAYPAGATRRSPRTSVLGTGGREGMSLRP